VVLRWHIQLGNIAIPKSVTPDQIRENLNVFDFSLDDDEMRQISHLSNGQRIGPDPETFNSF
jgi:2,5-diketo-D-gluconate reductase A